MEKRITDPIGPSGCYVACFLLSMALTAACRAPQRRWSNPIPYASTTGSVGREDRYADAMVMKSPDLQQAVVAIERVMQRNRFRRFGAECEPAEFCVMRFWRPSHLAEESTSRWERDHQHVYFRVEHQADYAQIEAIGVPAANGIVDCPHILEGWGECKPWVVQLQMVGNRDEIAKRSSGQWVAELQEKESRRFKALVRELLSQLSREGADRRTTPN